MQKYFKTDLRYGHLQYVLWNNNAMQLYKVRISGRHYSLKYDPSSRLLPHPKISGSLPSSTPHPQKRGQISLLFHSAPFLFNKKYFLRSLYSRNSFIRNLSIRNTPNTVEFEILVYLLVYLKKQIIV